jgi:hypothetical protein
LAVLVACVLLVQYQQFRVMERMASHMVDPIQDANQLVHSWISGGQKHTVTTTREEGESKSHWQRRHLDEIEAGWQQFPPDG